MTLICIGGFFGAIARYYLSNQLSKKLYFPLATFLINIFGCFLIGCILNFDVSNNINLLITIGFLGAFTTFSTFAIEVVQLVEKKQFLLAIVYIISSGIGGIGCTIIGLTIL